MLGNILVSIVFLIVQEMLFLSDTLFWWIVTIATVAFIVWWAFLFKANIKYIVIPLIYIIGSIGFLLVLPNNSLKHVFIIVSAVIFLFLLDMITKKVTKTYPLKDRRLSSFSLIIIATLFFVYSTVFSLYLYMNISSWIVIILNVGFSVIISLCFFDWEKLYRKGVIISLVVGLIILELTWALLFWPTGVIGRSIVLLAAMYVCLGLSRSFLTSGKIERRHIFDYLIISAVLIAVVLGTSKWIY